MYNSIYDCLNTYNLDLDLSVMHNLHVRCSTREGKCRRYNTKTYSRWPPEINKMMHHY